MDHDRRAAEQKGGGPEDAPSRREDWAHGRPTKGGRRAEGAGRAAGPRAEAPWGQIVGSSARAGANRSSGVSSSTMRPLR
jgi:hypothetical protein